MSEPGQAETGETQMNETFFPTGELKEKQMAMDHAMKRIDEGNGSLEDLDVVIINGAEVNVAYAKWASSHFRDQRFVSSVEEGAGKFTKARDGGVYGKMWFCSDIISYHYDQALQWRPAEASKSGSFLTDTHLKEAQNWEKMLIKVREAPFTQQGNRQ